MPTEIVNGLTDDQIALIGCGIALIVSGTIMSLSYYIGRGSRSEASQLDRLQGDVIPLIKLPATAETANQQPQTARRDAA